MQRDFTLRINTPGLSHLERAVALIERLKALGFSPSLALNMAAGGGAGNAGNAIRQEHATRLQNARHEHQIVMQANRQEHQARMMAARQEHQAHMAATRQQQQGMTNILMSAASAIYTLQRAVELAGDALRSLYSPAARIQIERLQLQALTGQPTMAKNILDFVQKLAVQTPLQFSDLMENAKMMTAFGVYSPERLRAASAAAVARGKPIEYTVTALGYLRAGRKGEALEALSRVGISRDELRTEGIRFRGADQRLVSPAEKTIDAVTRLMERKFGNVLDIMEQSALVQATNVVDVIFQQTGRIMGGTMGSSADLLKGIQEKIKEIADAIVASGFPEKMDELTRQVNQLLSDPAALRAFLITSFYDALSKALGYAIEKLLTDLPGILLRSLLEAMRINVVALGTIIVRLAEGLINGMASLMTSVLGMMGFNKAVLNQNRLNLRRQAGAAADQMIKGLRDVVGLPQPPVPPRQPVAEVPILGGLSVPSPPPRRAGQLGPGPGGTPAGAEDWRTLSQQLGISNGLLAEIKKSLK